MCTIEWEMPASRKTRCEIMVQLANTYVKTASIKKKRMLNEYVVAKIVEHCIIVTIKLLSYIEEYHVKQTTSESSVRSLPYQSKKYTNVFPFGTWCSQIDHRHWH